MKVYNESVNGIFEIGIKIQEIENQVEKHTNNRSTTFLTNTIVNHHTEKRPLASLSDRRMRLSEQPFLGKIASLELVAR